MAKAAKKLSDVFRKGSKPKRVQTPSKQRQKHRKLYTYQWSLVSKSYRQLHPFCVKCEAEGRTGPAEAVDHIKPHKGSYELFWDQGNWQSLCNACHNAKSATEK